MHKQKMLILLLCFVASSWAFAQQGTERPSNRMMNEEVKTAIELTAEQRTQLDALEGETQAAVEAIKAQSELDRTARRSALREVKRDHKTALEGLLSEEQLAKMKMLQQTEGRRRGEARQQTNRGMKAELRAYRAENMEPVLLVQRQQLESALSAEDKATLAEIRTKRELIREQRQAESNTRPRGRRHGNGMEDTQGQDALRAMAQRYEQQITAALAPLATQSAQWEADMEAIRQKHRPSAEARPTRDNKHEEGKQIMFLLQDPAGE